MRSAASQIRDRCEIVVLTVLLLLGLRMAKLSIWIYPYTENYDAKNVITGGCKDEGVFNWGSNLYCVILKFHLTLLPMRPFRAFLFGFLHFQGSKCPLRPEFPRKKNMSSDSKPFG